MNTLTTSRRLPWFDVWMRAGIAICVVVGAGVFVAIVHDAVFTATHECVRPGRAVCYEWTPNDGQPWFTNE